MLETLAQIIEIVFPQHDENRLQPMVQQEVFSIHGVTEEELREICGWIGDNKAPGLDRIKKKNSEVGC